MDSPMTPPEPKHCPFCKSTRLRKSLGNHLCKACGWWFRIVDQCYSKEGTRDDEQTA